MNARLFLLGARVFRFLKEEEVSTGEAPEQDDNDKRRLKTHAVPPRRCHQTINPAMNTATGMKKMESICTRPASCALN